MQLSRHSPLGVQGACSLYPIRCTFVPTQHPSVPTQHSSGADLPPALYKQPANPSSAPFPPLLMEGRMDRGGPTPACVDHRQEQYQRATPAPTTTTRGDGQTRSSTAPPSATHARGDRCGLTTRQQRPPTDLSLHALSLYRQCVAAGQWAQISLENRPDGQHITFSRSPRQQLLHAPRRARRGDGGPTRGGRRRSSSGCSLVSSSSCRQPW